MRASRSRAAASSAARSARAPGGVMAQLAGEHPDRQRQVPAEPGDLIHRRIPGADAGPGGQPGQQHRRLAGRQRVQGDHGGVFQRGQPTAAGDQHQAARGARQQRPHLLVARPRRRAAAGPSCPRPGSRQRAARASSPGGICAAATPAVSSRLASASAGSTGRWPGVWACSGRKNCPSGKLAASRCAACTAKVVLPIPAIPSIAWMPTTPAPTGG